MEYRFRTLFPEEIDCRVQQIKQTNKGGFGLSVLLYKDARCDMNILDETVGPENWQRKHEDHNGNLFCSVGVKYNDEWVWKEDAGAPSNTEAQKGHASDSFKRACTNHGIGRELYTSPFIWIEAMDGEITPGGNGKYRLKPGVSFHVSEISTDEKRRIVSLTLVDNKGNVRFSFPRQSRPAQKQEPHAAPQPETISATQAAWVTEMCKVLFGEKWSQSFYRATGYRYPHEITKADFPGIKARLEKKERSRRECISRF